MPRISAQIRAGLKHDDSRGTIFIGNVKLDLGEPHLQVPVNLPPQTRHVLLPPGQPSFEGQTWQPEVVTPRIDELGGRLFAARVTDPDIAAMPWPGHEYPRCTE